MLPLTACGTARPVVALPPVERTTPVPFPTIPTGEANCPDETGLPAPCLSDRETGTLIADLAKALDTANAKLEWLGDFFNGMR